MSGMLIRARYLGSNAGSFTDKDTGEVIAWSRVYVWDGDAPLTIKPHKEYRTFAADTAGLVFGDEVLIEASVTATASGITFRATNIAKGK